MIKIIVLEDNIEINNILSNLLNEAGYKVLSSFNAFDAYKDFNNNKVECIITDLMLPIKSGEEFISDIRKISNVHIIIISAKATLDEKLKGLKIGADDYLIKPFSADEVLIKINNIFSKKEKLQSKKSLNHGQIVFEEGNNSILIDNKKIELTSVEYMMISLLFKEVNKIITRDQFLDHLYNNEVYVYDRVVDTHIKNIRQKIKKVTNTTLIKTIYGLGYMIEGELDG